VARSPKTRGGVFDRLQSAQVALDRDADGLGKFLACSPATLARIAVPRPGDIEALAWVPGMDDPRVKRLPRHPSAPPDPPRAWTCYAC
jgi:hypothetical protein